MVDAPHGRGHRERIQPGPKTVAGQTDLFLAEQQRIGRAVSHVANPNARCPEADHSNPAARNVAAIKAGALIIANTSASAEAALGILGFRIPASPVTGRRPRCGLQRGLSADVVNGILTTCIRITRALIHRDDGGLCRSGLEAAFQAELPVGGIGHILLSDARAAIPEAIWLKRFVFQIGDGNHANCMQSHRSGGWCCNPNRNSQRRSPQRESNCGYRGNYISPK